MGLIQTMRSMFQRFAPLHDPADVPFKEGHLALSEWGFELTRAGQVRAAVNWPDVRQIATFKRDLFAYDSICIEFELSGNRFVEICEEMVGFMDVSEAMRERFPAISEDWYFSVMSEPFATNYAVLWRSP